MQQGRVVLLETVVRPPRWSGEPKARCEIVDLRREFGVAGAATAILAYVLAKDESVGVRFGIGPRPGVLQVRQSTRAAFRFAGSGGQVTLAGDGTIYFYLSGELDSVYLGVAGYIL